MKLTEQTLANFLSKMIDNFVYKKEYFYKNKFIKDLEFLLKSVKTFQKKNKL